MRSSSLFRLPSAIRNVHPASIVVLRSGGLVGRRWAWPWPSRNWRIEPTTWSCCSSVSSGYIGRASVSLRGGLGDGEVAGLVAEGGEAGLQVERDRVVDLGPDLAARQVVAQGVADRGRDADDVLVVDVVDGPAARRGG